MLLTLKTIILLFRTLGVPNLGIQSLEKYSCIMDTEEWIIIFPPKIRCLLVCAGFTGLPPDIYK